MMSRKRRLVLGVIVLALPACDVDVQDSTSLEALEAGEQDAEEAADEEAAAEEQEENVPEVSFRAATDFGDSCYWNKWSGSGALALMIHCWYGDQIVAGGCYSYSASDQIHASMPFENNSLSDFPEDGERADATDGATGWLCYRDGSANYFYGVALCCDF